MINHLSGHAAIYTDVLARDETSLVRTEKEHHTGYIQGIADTRATYYNDNFILEIHICITSKKWNLTY